MGLVVALTIAAGAAVAVKGFTLGLDLRGGLEVVLKARPTDGQTITSDTLTQAADVMRRRIDPRGILQPEIRTSPSDNDDRHLHPGRQEPERGREPARRRPAPELRLLQVPDPGLDARARTWRRRNPSLYDMLRAAKKQIPTGTPAGWALFSAKAPHSLAKANGIVSRIEPLQRQVLEDIHLKAKPAGTVWLPVPQGTAAVSCSSVLPRRAGARDGLVPVQDPDPGLADRDGQRDLERQGRHRPGRAPDRLALVQERRRPGLHRHHPGDRNRREPARSRPTRRGSTTRSSSTTSWSPPRRWTRGRIRTGSTRR